MKILNVTSEGLTYLDDSNNSIFIDFKVCNEHWIMYNKRTNNWTDDEAAEFRYRSKCIGRRDICGKPCYFTFFTKPFTKIEFTGFRAKEKFMDLQMEILNAGWTTFDLS